MGYRYLHLFCPIIALGINVIVQIVIFKLDKRHKLLRSVFMGFAAGVLSAGTIESFIVLTTSASIKEFMPVLIVDITTYFALGYCYFHFINMGESARRVRLLRELEAAPGGLTEWQILSKYNAKEMVNIRLTRLLNNNQIKLRDERYYAANSAMLFFSKALVFMKLIISGKNI